MVPDDSVVLYNVACNLATLGETDKAIDYLEQASEHGAVSAAWMRNDEDLVSLRNEPRYIALLERVG
jgi:adenylate cyclase